MSEVPEYYYWNKKQMAESTPSCWSSRENLKRKRLIRFEVAASINVTKYAKAILRDVKSDFGGGVSETFD